MSFAEQFGDGLSGYFRRTLGLYVFTLMLLGAGVAFGAWAVRLLSPEQLAELGRELGTMLDSLARPASAPDPRSVLRAAMATHLKTAGLLWLFGAAVLGAPGVLFLVFLRGFAAGFTVGFFIHHHGWLGLLMALGGVLPPTLIAVPGTLFLASSALAYAWLVARTRGPWGRRAARAVRLPEEFLAYCFVALAATATLMGAALLEAYVSPAVLRWLAALRA